MHAPDKPKSTLTSSADDTPALSATYLYDIEELRVAAAYALDAEDLQLAYRIYRRISYLMRRAM